MGVGKESIPDKRNGRCESHCGGKGGSALSKFQELKEV